MRTGTETLRALVGLVAVLSVSPLGGAVQAPPEGDVVLLTHVDPATAARLFASAEAAVYLPEEAVAFVFTASGEAGGESVVARRVRADELGPRFRPTRGRPYLLKEPSTLESALGSPVSERPDRESPVAAPSAVPFVEGFENGLASWVRVDDTLGLYEWGTTSCEARTGRFSADAVRGGANNLSCSGSYGSSTVTELRHASCESLAGATRSSLDVYLHVETESGFDAVGFYYEGSDGMWHGYRFSGTWTAWFHVVLNLKQWYVVGDVTALPCPKLLIRFDSDESEEPGFGARLDDLTVGAESPSFLTAAFQASPGSGGAPLTVSFTSVVSGASPSAEYLWSFGDAAETTSTSRNATFRYDVPGDYVVRLRVSDSGVRAYAHQTIHVTSGGPTCSVTCSASAPATAIAGTAVTFTGSATATACASAPTYGWTFGDGASSTLPSPAHLYAAAGTYAWTLTATADGQTCVRNGSITVTSPPAGAGVSAGTATGPAGGSVSIPLSFAAGGAEVTAVSVDLAFDPSLGFVSASRGAAASLAGKEIAAASGTGAARLVVYGLNRTRLADGVLATVTLAVRPGTREGTLPLLVSASGTDSGARAVSVQGKPGGVTVSGAVAAATSLLVPVVLSVAGAAGSFYSSELTLTNRGADEALVALDYTASLGGGSGAVTERLAAGRQLIVPDAISWLRGKGLAIPGSGSRLGTLRVTSASASVSATCRTATAVPEGRAGLAYPGASPEQLLTSPAYLAGLRRDAADRSNVAVVHAGDPGSGDVRVRLTVRSGDPASPASGSLETEAIPPGGWLQLSLDDLLSRAGVSLASPNVFVRVERSSGSAPIYAYGVINDNGTSDGSFVAPIAEGALQGKRTLTVPVVVETATFVSEVTLTNVGTQPRTLLLTYVASAITSPGNVATQTLTLQPGEQRILPGFVAFLRALGTSGVGPPGPTFAGALFVSALTGDVSGILVGARTSAAGGAGRYGLFYPACADGTAADGAAWLFGLQQNADNRTNLALVNTGESGSSPVTLRLELWNGDTGQKVATVEGTETTLDARRFTQIDRVLQRWAPGVTNGYARVSRVSGTNPFLTYAVVNDGAEPGQRSGDGAYVPMQVER